MCRLGVCVHTTSFLYICLQKTQRLHHTLFYYVLLLLYYYYRFCFVRNNKLYYWNNLALFINI